MLFPRTNLSAILRDDWIAVLSDGQSMEGGLYGELCRTIQHDSSTGDQQIAKCRKTLLASTAHGHDALERYERHPLERRRDNFFVPNFHQDCHTRNGRSHGNCQIEKAFRYPGRGTQIVVRRNVSEGQRPEHPVLHQLFHLDWFGSIDGRDARVSQERPEAHPRPGKGERSSSNCCSSGRFERRGFRRRFLVGVVFHVFFHLFVIFFVFLLQQLRLQFFIAI